MKKVLNKTLGIRIIELIILLTSGFIFGTSTNISIVNTYNFIEMYGTYKTFITLDSRGDLWDQGWNASGQIEDGTQTNQLSPVKITDDSILDIVNVCENNNTFIALDSNGDLWVWGWNNKGQVGNDDKGNDQTTPVQITNQPSNIE